MFRIVDDEKLKNYGEYAVTGDDEWCNDDPRYKDPTWIERYKHESSIITECIKDKNVEKILELGSGPGTLSQYVQKANPSVKYDLIDRFHAKKTFEKENYKGRFFVKDLLNGFDVEGLETDYDLIIANDFLEHIFNPADIMRKCYSISKPNSHIFISVPNWRMGHGFIYRGLFDYDNFIYFCYGHGYNIFSVYQSILKCTPLPKISSESCMPDDLMESWNWYFFGVKKT